MARADTKLEEFEFEWKIRIFQCDEKMLVGKTAV
jgi:hypothetical protein